MHAACIQGNICSQLELGRYHEPVECLSECHHHNLLLLQIDHELDTDAQAGRQADRRTDGQTGGRTWLYIPKPIQPSVKYNTAAIEHIGGKVKKGKKERQKEERISIISLLPLHRNVMALSYFMVRVKGSFSIVLGSFRLQRS